MSLIMHVSEAIGAVDSEQRHPAKLTTNAQGQTTSARWADYLYLEMNSSCPSVTVTRIYNFPQLAAVETTDSPTLTPLTVTRTPTLEKATKKRGVAVMCF